MTPEQTAPLDAALPSQPIETETGCEPSLPLRGAAAFVHLQQAVARRNAEAGFSD